MQNYLPNTVEELFEVGETEYRYFSEDSMDNNWSMDWFIKYLDLSEFVQVFDGTQIIVSHQDFDKYLQIDAGGLGDFFSHSFKVSFCEKCW